MKKHLKTILVVLILMAGLSLLLYPTASDYWNKIHQSKAITEYAEAVNLMDEERFQKMWDDAVTYNAALYASYQGVDLTNTVNGDYDSILNVTGDGMMAYLSIPKIHCKLPVYHGTDTVTLQSNVGHLVSSSLPVGGENTHCVLSGHTGLPSARLLTDLELMELGDTFSVITLGQPLTYEVDQILVVLPHEVDSLKIEAGKDLCTLITCTPYGVNSHRLLVRGHRIETPEDEPGLEPDSGILDTLQIEPMFLVLAGIVILILILLLILRRRSDKKRRENNGKNHDQKPD